jgi:hypothetical protein
MLAAAVDRLQGVRALARSYTKALSRSQSKKFVTTAPSAQTAIDAASEKWVSKLPPPHEQVHAGQAEQFDDPRIHWALKRLGGVTGMRVVDLGPLEGGLSYMAQQAGAACVVGVEANRIAFLKCLVTKELFALDRCSFLCGDVNEYLATEVEPFDVCIACGILYHMTDPMRLLDLISQRASRLILWTHIYSDEALRNTQLAGRLGSEVKKIYEGFDYRVYPHTYALDWRLPTFSGGVARHSNWMHRDDLFRALDHFDWRVLEVDFDEPPSPNGPSVAVVAERGSR